MGVCSCLKVFTNAPTHPTHTPTRRGIHAVASNIWFRFLSLFCHSLQPKQIWQDSKTDLTASHLPTSEEACRSHQYRFIQSPYISIIITQNYFTMFTRYAPIYSGWYYDARTGIFILPWELFFHWLNLKVGQLWSQLGTVLQRF